MQMCSPCRRRSGSVDRAVKARWCLLVPPSPRGQSLCWAAQPRGTSAATCPACKPPSCSRDRAPRADVVLEETPSTPRAECARSNYTSSRDEGALCSPLAWPRSTRTAAREVCRAREHPLVRDHGQCQRDDAEQNLGQALVLGAHAADCAGASAETSAGFLVDSFVGWPGHRTTKAITAATTFVTKTRYFFTSTRTPT